MPISAPNEFAVLRSRFPKNNIFSYVDLVMLKKEIETSAATYSLENAYHVLSKRFKDSIWQYANPITYKKCLYPISHVRAKNY